MASNKTPNLNLPQYSGTDLFNLEEINESYKKIDNSYKEINDNYNKAIQEGSTGNLEVIDARGGYDNLGQKIKSIDSSLDTIETEINKPITLNKCDEEMLGAIQNKEGETTFNLLSIPRDKSVTPPKTSFFEINKEGNLIDRNNLIKGYYYLNTGEKNIDNNAYTTDFIEFDNSIAYRFNFISFVTYWNVNKEFISGYIQGASFPDVPCDLENTPQNAKYVRFSVFNDSLSTCVFCKKELYDKNLKTNYFLKETIIKEELLDDNLKNKINNTTTDNYFSNKKITFIGDSITYGVDGNTNGEVVEKPYPTLVSEILGCNCINLGIPGSTIAGDGVTDSDITHNKIGYFPINERYTQIESDSNYIIVFAGINDFTANVKTPLGTKGDSTKMTFYGALKILLDGLIEKYPNSKLGFITPLKKSGWYNNNEYGVNLKKYYNAIIEMCEERSIPVLDFFKNGGCYGEIQAWKNINLPDGLHPTQVYYNKLSRTISEFIKCI